MAIPIKDNTTALEALKTKAQSLPNRESGSTGDGYDTSDATTEAADVREGKVFYGANGRDTGTAGEYPVGDSRWLPQTEDYYLTTDGKFVIGNVVIAGDANFIESNIKKGVTMFNKTGTYDPGSSDGYDTSDATAESADVRAGKVFYNAYGYQIGSMEDAVLGTVTLTAGEASGVDTADIKIAVEQAGYLDGDADDGGRITVATLQAIQTGYEVDITSNGSHNISTAGKYAFADIKVNVDAGDDFSEENIVSGKTILGKTGTYVGSSKVQTTTYNSAVTDIVVPYKLMTNGTVLVIKVQSITTSSSSSSKLVVSSLTYNADAGAFTVQGYSSISGENKVYSSYGDDLNVNISEDATSITLSGSILISYESAADGEIYSDYVTLEFKGSYDVYLV